MQPLHVAKNSAIALAICVLLFNIFLRFNYQKEGIGARSEDFVDGLRSMQEKLQSMQEHQADLRRDLTIAIHHISAESYKLTDHIKKAERKQLASEEIKPNHVQVTKRRKQEKTEPRKARGNLVTAAAKSSSGGEKPKAQREDRVSSKELTSKSTKVTSPTVGAKENTGVPTVGAKSVSTMQPTRSTQSTEQVKSGLSERDQAIAQAVCEVPKVDPFNPVVTKFVKKLPKLKCNQTALSRIEDGMVKFDVKNVKGAVVIWIKRFLGDYDYWLDYSEWISFIKSFKKVDLNEAKKKVGCIGFGDIKHITNKLKISEKSCAAQHYFHFKDGRINVLHKKSCIFASEEKLNGKVTIEDKCSTDQSRFTIEDGGKLKHAATGLCLSIANSAEDVNMQYVLLGHCNATAATFHFIEPQTENVKAKVPLQQDCFKVLFVFSDNTFQIDFHLHAAPIPADKLPKVDPATEGKGLNTNIAFVMFDSQSNANFHRLMQRSISYMKSDENTVMFNSHTVVGDATSPQLVAMLTGRRITDLPESRRDIKGSGYLDDWPFIFKDLHKSGYVTQFAEDDPMIGGFNLRFWGFYRPPTTHYGRPYWLDAMPQCREYAEAHFCIGDRPLHRINIDYMTSLYKTHPKQRKFSFIITSKLVHDTFYGVQRSDGDVVEILSQTKGEGILNDTILVVLGDHGSRYGPLRETIQGKIEERLPFFSVTLPDRIAKQHPDLLANMKRNSRLLTSHFDVYATLRHILSYPAPPTGLRFGNSLFTHLNASRSCEEIGVPDLWCPCLTFEEVKVSDPIASKIAAKAVGTMNEHLAQNEHLAKVCSRLELDRVTHIGKKIPNKRIQRYYYSDSNEKCATCKVVENNKEVFRDVLYEISFTAKPSGGKFEALVQDFGDGTMKVKGDISRINKYGTQAKCIEESHPHARKYCFCK